MLVCVVCDEKFSREQLLSFPENYQKGKEWASFFNLDYSAILSKNRPKICTSCYEKVPHCSTKKSITNPTIYSDLTAGSSTSSVGVSILPELYTNLATRYEKMEHSHLTHTKSPKHKQSMNVEQFQQMNKHQFQFNNLEVESIGGDSVRVLEVESSETSESNSNTSLQEDTEYDDEESMTDESYTSNLEDPDYQDFNEELQTQNPKFVLVEVDQLLKLFQTCPNCMKARNEVQLLLKGSCPTLKGVCFCGEYLWHGQKTSASRNEQKEHIYSGNLSMATACLLSGISYSELNCFSKLMKMANISRALYHFYTKKFIKPKISQHHKVHQKLIREKIIKESQNHNKEVHLTGDCQFDSPGYTASLGHYTFGDVNTKLIIHGEVVHKREVENISSRIEPTAFQRGLDLLLCDTRINIVSLTTDQNSTISAIMKSKYPQLQHFLDWYHYAKNWRSKLYNLSKKAAYKELREILPYLYNFFCIGLQLGGNNPDLTREYLQSMTYHIQGIHSWKKDQNFHIIDKCAHEPRPNGDVKLNAQSLSFVALKESLYDNSFVENLKKVRYHHNTSYIEAYNSVFIHYAPKSKYFDKSSYNIRMKLADIHFNESVMEGDRTVRIKKVYSRSARMYVNKKIKKPPSINWKHWLFNSIQTDAVALIADKTIEESEPED